jgi:hypothetical protein
MPLIIGIAALHFVTQSVQPGGSVILPDRQSVLASSRVTCLLCLAKYMGARLVQDSLNLRRSVTLFGFALLVWVGSSGQPIEVFALLLFSAVVARSVWGARHIAHVPNLVVGFARRTARGVYLLMYMLVGIELLRAMATLTPPHTERCLPYLGCVVAAQLFVPVKDGGTPVAAVKPTDIL